MPDKQADDKLLAAVFTSLIAELVLLTLIVLVTQYWSTASFALVAWVVAVPVNNIYFMVKLVRVKPKLYVLHTLLMLLPIVFIVVSSFYLIYSFRDITC
ncbi:hypothetical protein KJK34_12055 [Flavobacterium sp. D11R37]|uniref:hypothetical protein n=1 Tax=Flavobacterium coralii TaxID=2838017 RepID=UPI001CA677F5|nr:hypothetical protein [Flavobacterium coralii]MBY8963489.1 hypothetical protein [Flavobacterium coralii]